MRILQRAGLLAAAFAAMVMTTATRAQMARKFINLSSRGMVETGSETFTAGFTVQSTTPHRILIRAIGPTLAKWHVANVDPAPVILLYKSENGTSKFLGRYAGWDPSLAAVFAQVGEFALPPGSKDSAVMLTLPQGGYTAQVVSDTPGDVAMIEVDDVDQQMAGGLINLSVLGKLVPGDGNMILGWTLAGDGSVRLLVRAIGPSLAEFGITGYVPDPQLTLSRFTTQWMPTTNHDVNDYLPSVFTAYGAFPIPFMSKDAVISWPDDLSGWTIQYTAPVRSVSGTTGVCLVEVYIKNE